MTWATLADSGASIVIPCYTEKRWDQLVVAVESALAQDPPPAEVLVCVDYNDALYDRAKRELRGVTVARNRFDRGVSGGRNTGVELTQAPIIVLLDDDAAMRPGTLKSLIAPFDDPSVIGTGGAIAPNWERSQPRWFPDEFLWVVTASYTGMPTEAAEVRNVWGACMAVRRDVFTAVGGFRLDFGRLDDAYRAEDTDLCLRMSKASGGRWMYVPDSVIEHPVPAYRTTFRYFLSRCYHEGRGKVGIARHNDGRQSLDSERDYLRLTLPRAVGRGVWDTLSGHDPAGIARAAAVVAGVAAAAVGGIVETIAWRRRPRGVAQVALQQGGGE
jgi:GT2 family glycosyltransferase